MTALEAPVELLLVVLFREAVRVEPAVESLWRRGFDSNRLSLLARNPGSMVNEAGQRVPDWRRQRAVSPHLWFQFQRAALVELPETGLVVALGPLATELTEGPAARRGAARLPVALRRLGLPETEAPGFERALHDRHVILVARVPRQDAHEWAALLQVAGATAITAHLRLDPWPHVHKERKARRVPRRRTHRHHTLV